MTVLDSSIMPGYSNYHLCHLNVGPAVAHILAPEMAGFVENLERINQLAYDSPGFVWHLKIDIYNPEDLAMYGEPGMLFNYSIWESPQALWDYTYRSAHGKIMQRRKEWFHKMTTPNYVLWWVPKGTIPTLKEAKRRLNSLTQKGPTPENFTFHNLFQPSGYHVSTTTENSKILLK